MHAKTVSSFDYNSLSNKPALFNGTWISLTGKPSTISGYGITDFDFTGTVTNDLLKFNGTKWVKFTPNYLTTFTETQNLASVLSYSNNGNGKQIKNIANPTDSKDAVTKNYVDSLKQHVQDLESLVFSQLAMPTKGLIAYYPFNGNSNDASGNSINGVITNATQSIDRLGNSNGAYIFNGSSYIDYSTFPSLKQPFTISCWVNLSQFSGQEGEVVLSKYIAGDSNNSEFLIRINTDSTISLATFGNIQVVSSNTKIKTNHWYFICGVFNGSHSQIFVDKDLVATDSLNTTNITSTPMRIGGYSSVMPSHTQSYFDGIIDDIRFYNRPLTSVEVNLIYNEDDFPSTIVHDVNGNSYNTIKIGSQYWMVQNLNTTKYNNGDPIPNITDNTTWIGLSSGAYCDYDNSLNNSSIYGRLYNYYAVVDSRGLCPNGWHVPSDTEWETLFTYIGGSSVAGGKLKEVGIIRWNAPNTNATNEFGFTGLPAGYRNNTGVFSSLGVYSNLWTLTPASPTNANIRGLGYNYEYIFNTNFPKHNGLSIRCIKD